MSSISYSSTMMEMTDDKLKALVAQMENEAKASESLTEAVKMRLVLETLENSCKPNDIDVTTWDVTPRPDRWHLFADVSDDQNHPWIARFRNCVGKENLCTVVEKLYDLVGRTIAASFPSATPVDFSSFDIDEIKAASKCIKQIGLEMFPLAPSVAGLNFL